MGEKVRFKLKKNQKGLQMEYKRVKKYFDKKVGQILMYPINFIVSNFIEGERSDAYGEDRA